MISELALNGLKDGECRFVKRPDQWYMSYSVVANSGGRRRWVVTDSTDEPIVVFKER